MFIFLRYFVIGRHLTGFVLITNQEKSLLRISPGLQQVFTDLCSRVCSSDCEMRCWWGQGRRWFTLVTHPTQRRNPISRIAHLVAEHKHTPIMICTHTIVDQSLQYTANIGRSSSRIKTDNTRLAHDGVGKLNYRWESQLDGSLYVAHACCADFRPKTSSFSCAG